MMMMMQQLQGSNSVQCQPRNGGDCAAEKQPWYRRALRGLVPWARPAAIAAPPAPAPAARTAEQRPRWWWASSLKATSAAVTKELCICVPLCSFDGIMGVQVDAVAPRMVAGSAGCGVSPSPPRRASPGRAPAAAAGGQGARTVLSPSPPRRASPARAAAVVVAAPAGQGARTVLLFPTPPRRASPGRSPAVAVAPAAAVEGPRRRVSFSGGDSLWNDELRRRFLLAQEGLPRRGEMAIADRHRRRRWRAPGASRFRRMSLAHVATDEAGET